MNDVYRPPESDLVSESNEQGLEFYVVSKTKLSVLFIATVGFYIVFWFYENWKKYKRVSGEAIWPAPRALFNVFFTHALFKKIDEAKQDKNIEYTWSPMLLATLFIILSIISNFFDSVLSAVNMLSPAMYLFLLIIFFALLLIMIKVQTVVNLTQGDPQGLSNSKFTPLNYMWLLFGIVIWGLVAVGVLDGLGMLALDG